MKAHSFVSSHLVLSKMRKRLEDLISGRGPLEKPIAPKMPISTKLTPPANTIAIECQAWEHQASGDIEFYQEDMRPSVKVWENLVDKEDFYSEWEILDYSNQTLIKDFADCVDVSPEDVVIFPLDDCGLVYKVIKKIDSKEFAKKYREYEEEVRKQKYALENYHKDYEKYIDDLKTWQMIVFKKEIDRVRIEASNS